MDSIIQVRLWAVIGGAKTGKSTIIGNLASQTERGPGGFRNILLQGGGYLQIYARRQSLQEAKITSDDFVETIKSKMTSPRTHGAINVLLALRSDPTRSLPLADDYIRSFISVGWLVQALVYLNPSDNALERYMCFGAPLCVVPDSKSQIQDSLAHQKIVGQVRRHFGWA